MSLVSRAFYGVDDVRAYLSNKTSLAKIRLMQLFGINMSALLSPPPLRTNAVQIPHLPP